MNFEYIMRSNNSYPWFIKVDKNEHLSYFQC